MSELTREQVERLIPLAKMDASTVNLGHEQQASFVGIFSALAIMIDTDAALRAKLVASEAAAYDVTNTIQALKDKLAQANEHLEAQRQATYQAVEREHTAKRQLADKDAEIAALKHQLSQLLFFTPGGG